MRKLAKKIGSVPPARKPQKKSVRPSRRPAQSKWISKAQMPDYLMEEHPELCN